MYVLDITLEKQKLIQVIRAAEYPKKSFVFKIFAALIFLLIKDEVIERVVIDKEYTGNEMTINNIILQLFRRGKIKKPEIDFDLIGKKSRVHQIAANLKIMSRFLPPSQPAPSTPVSLQGRKLFSRCFLNFYAVSNRPIWEN